MRRGLVRGRVEGVLFDDLRGGVFVCSQGCRGAICLITELEPGVGKPLPDGLGAGGGEDQRDDMRWVGLFDVAELDFDPTRRRGSACQFEDGVEVPAGVLDVVSGEEQAVTPAEGCQ